MADDIQRIARVHANGWELAMILVRLPRNGVLVHSPTWIGDDTFARVEAFGEPTVLFAPNHYHHMSLRRFHERWPQAPVAAGRVAVPRLRAHGHDYVTPSDALRASELVGAALGTPVRLLECAGTRAGETFLAVAGRRWIVSDAFFNVSRPVTGIAGAGLRLLRATPGLCIGQTFRWLALRNVGAYRSWLLGAIEREKPRELWMSHGEVVRGDDLPDRLVRLAEERLR